MVTYEIARNERTALYEIHVAGCKHLISKHLERCSTVETDKTAAELAADYEHNNDGVLTKLGPCAR